MDLVQASNLEEFRFGADRYLKGLTTGKVPVAATEEELSDVGK